MLSENDLVVLEAIKEELFKQSPIEIKTSGVSDPQGVSSVTNKMWLSPFITATDCSLGNLIHEMAHFVEIDKKRMNLHNWGLRRPKKRLMGQEFCEPVTTQITIRELRVFAFQHNIHEHFGIDTWKNQIVEICEYLPDRYNVPGYSIGKKQLFNDWIMGNYYRFANSKEYSYEIFKKEWDKRNAILLKKVAYR